MFCIGCGSGLPGDARFCTACGRAVQQAAPSSPACLACRTPLPPGMLGCPSCAAVHQYCRHCGGFVLAAASACQHCSAPIAPAPVPGLRLADFQHPSMQLVNDAMRKSAVLRAFSESVSKRVGRPWYESTFNSFPVTDAQYPRLNELALLAARRVGLQNRPSVYVETDRPHASATYGSKDDAFVNIGSFLSRLLTDRELLFVIGHEYGHLLGEHALWMTVSNLLFGEHRANLMSQGFLAFLNPVQLLTAGAEAVVANWMRVADFTADRLGLLVVGDLETARRSLFLLYVKSRAVLGDVDLDEWVRKQEAKGAQVAKVSQLLSSGAPYLGIRMNELMKFATSDQYRSARGKLEARAEGSLDGVFDEEGYLKRFGKPARQAGAQQPPPLPPRSGTPPAVPGRRRVIRSSCPGCHRQHALDLAKHPSAQYVYVECSACHRRYRIALAKVQAGGRPDTTRVVPPVPEG